VDATAATTPFAKTGSKVHSRLPGFILEVAPGSEDLPILLAMTELPLADARNRLSELVADVEQTQERVMITKHGHPAAVLISPDDLASLEETLDVLSDPDALADIRDAEAEAGRGEYTSAEQMHLLLEERRRRDSGAA
jgi:prevent-host-death family protein